MPAVTTDRQDCKPCGRNMGQETTHNMPNALPSLAPVAEKVGALSPDRLRWNCGKKSGALLQAQEETQTLPLPVLTVQHNHSTRKSMPLKKLCRNRPMTPRKTRRVKSFRKQLSLSKAKRIPWRCSQKHRNHLEPAHTFRGLKANIETQEGSWRDLRAVSNFSGTPGSGASGISCGADLLAIALIALFSSWIDSSSAVFRWTGAR